MASIDSVALLSQLLECPVCTEQSSDHRVLPCLHSFCADCLNSHMSEQEKSGAFPCPMCKIQFPVPSEGVTGFQQNFFHASICDIVSNTNSKNKMHCSIHEGRILEFYCEQCKVPICTRCITSNHNQHKLKDLDVAAKEATEAIIKMLKPQNEVKEHWEKLYDERQKVLESLSQQQKSCKSEIHRMYSEFLAEITRQVKFNVEKAIVQLDEQIEVARKQAEAACDEAELNRAKFANVMEYVNTVLESYHDAQKLQQFEQIKSLLENLNDGQIEKQATKPVFKIRAANYEIPSMSAHIVTVSENKLVLCKISPNLATNVDVYSKSLGDRVTPLPPVKEPVQLEQRFSSLSWWGRRKDNYNWCWGLAVGDGVLIVTDISSRAAKVFDIKKMKLKFTLNTTQHQLQSPRDVTCNRLGEIFITDDGIHGVVKYDVKGRLMKVYPRVYEGMGRITCHIDQLIVADTQGGRVMYTDFEFKVHHQIEACSLGLREFSPRYICVDENSGHLVVSQFAPPRVYVIDPTQPAVTHTFSDELCEPHGVCVDQFGHILVADSDYPNHRIILLTPERARVIATGVEISEPTAICTSDPGQVYVLELGGDVKVFKYLDI